MNSALRPWRLLVGFVAVGVWTNSVAHAEHDLDAMANEDLLKALEAELKIVDAYTDEQVDTEDEVVADFLYALGNEGDSDDGGTSGIDRADLDAEMEEAGTTLEAVVEAAVHKYYKTESPQDDRLRKKLHSAMRETVNRIAANVHKPRRPE